MKRKAGAPSSVPTRQMHCRTLVLMSVCGIGAFLILLIRLYMLQIGDHEHYESMAISQQLRQAPTTAERGVIYDRNMEPLAVSASVENIYLSPAEIEMNGEDKELIADGLSEILGLDRNDILNKEKQSGAWYVTVARKADRETAQKVRQFKLDNSLSGVRLETDTKRLYPNSSLACHVVGFVGTDNYGLEGIEAQYNSYLAGTAGKTVRAANAYGTELLFSGFEDFKPGREGLNIVTTLDTSIQYYIEKHLKQAVRDYDIQNGAGAIAMDVNTGEILAMVSLDGYDLNNFLDVSDEVKALAKAAQTKEEKENILKEAQTKQWRNKALSDTYEPGSTFKIITLAMALEEGAVSENSSFYCPGAVNVQGRTSPIRCWKSGGHGSQSLTEAVQHSCNVAFVNIGQRIGSEKFYEYCDAFGLLNLSEDSDASLSAKTGIDLAGESGSIWWSKNTFCSKKNLSQLAAASFGQTFTITPLQLISAVSACVNGGNLMRPYVVGKITDPSGNIVKEKEPEKIRQVISEKTSAKVREILEKVVGDQNEGTGRNAAVEGYRIGGKTGTSEKVSLEAKTGKKEYIVSFIGFAPADAPKIAVLIFLDTPSDKSGIYISGGQMAAPVVGRIMADVLPYLQIDNSRDNSSSAVMPMLLEKDITEAKALLDDASLRYRTIGDGNKITSQLPAAGTSIAQGSEVILYFDRPISPDNETIPELVGMRYEDARDTLSYYGLYLHSISPVDDKKELISWQNISPGTMMKHGSVVEVSLMKDDDTMLGRY